MTDETRVEVHAYVQRMRDTFPSQCPVRWLLALHEAVRPFGGLAALRREDDPDDEGLLQ